MSVCYVVSAIAAASSRASAGAPAKPHGRVFPFSRKVQLRPERVTPRVGPVIRRMFEDLADLFGKGRKFGPPSEFCVLYADPGVPTLYTIFPENQNMNLRADGPVPVRRTLPAGDALGRTRWGRN